MRHKRRQFRFVTCNHSAIAVFVETAPSALNRCKSRKNSQIYIEKQKVSAFADYILFRECWAVSQMDPRDELPVAYPAINRGGRSVWSTARPGSFVKRWPLQLSSTSFDRRQFTVSCEAATLSNHANDTYWWSTCRSKVSKSKVWTKCSRKVLLSFVIPKFP